MNYLRHLVDSKGAFNLLVRAVMICKRFGLTREKSEKALDRIVALIHKHGCVPSLFITAELLDNYGDLIQRISGNKVHVGLHGHYHIDYGHMSRVEQRKEISAGLEKFKDRGIQISGFRGPFLRHNEETAQAVADNDISWISHSVMLMNHNANSILLKESDNVQRLIENFYAQRDHSATPSIPYFAQTCLEIPVSLPDDEMLVDRLRIHDPDQFTAIWSDMLDSTREEGELLNLLFHPERIDYVGKPLEVILQKASAHGDVWIASLDEIARWWQERAAFGFRVTKGGSNDYRLIVNGNVRNSVSLQHTDRELEFVEPEKDDTFRIRTNFRPVIGAASDSPTESLEILRNEGFLLDFDADPSDCALALNNARPQNARQILETVDNEAKGPLLRFWRWPNRCRSALAITADVDAITIWDFFRRARHFRKARSR